MPHSDRDHKATADKNGRSKPPAPPCFCSGCRSNGSVISRSRRPGSGSRQRLSARIALTTTALCSYHAFANTETANETEPAGNKERSSSHHLEIHGDCTDCRPRKEETTDCNRCAESTILKPGRANAADNHDRKETDKEETIDSCVDVRVVGWSRCRDQKNPADDTPCAE